MVRCTWQRQKSRSSLRWYPRLCGASCSRAAPTECSTTWTVEALEREARQQGLDTAEALALQLRLPAVQLTLAWQARPSSVLGPCPAWASSCKGNAYSLALSLFASSGGVIRHMLEETTQSVTDLNVGTFVGRSVSFVCPFLAGIAAPGQQAEAGAFPEALVNDLVAAGTLVEDLADPAAWVSMARQMGCGFAVHVPSLMDAAWRILPSRLLGRRPPWLPPHSEPAGLNYTNLVLLAAKSGWTTVVNALRQPGLLHADAVFSGMLDELDSAKSILDGWDLQAAEDVYDKARDVRDARPTAGPQRFPDVACVDVRGIFMTQQRPADTTELVCVSLLPTGEASISLPQRSQDPGQAVLPQLSGALRERLLCWSGIRRGSDLHSLRAEEWKRHSTIGKRFDIREAIKEYRKRGLTPLQKVIPTPLELCDAGYVSKYMQLFTTTDEFVLARLRRIAAQPQSLACAYVIRFANSWDGRHAGRLDEIVEYLGAVRTADEQERILDCPPGQLLARIQREKSLDDVELRRFDWWRGLPDELETGNPELVVRLLKSSHQVAAAADRLNNCARSMIGEVARKECILLTAHRKRDGRVADAPVAMAQWCGRWSSIKGPCNQTVPADVKLAFKSVQPAVRSAWFEEKLENAIQSRSVLRLDRAIKSAQAAHMPKASLTLERAQDTLRELRMGTAESISQFVQRDVLHGAAARVM